MTVPPVTDPFEPIELHQHAEKAVRRLRVPARWQEDAVAEYIAAAWLAGRNAGGRTNIQGYQCSRGNGAVRHFVRRELRQERLAPGACPIGAARVSLDMPVPDGEEDTASLSETVADRVLPVPGARLESLERRKALRQGWGWLHPGQREAAMRVWLHGEPKGRVAAGLGISRKALRDTLESTREVLGLFMADYDPECQPAETFSMRNKKSDISTKPAGERDRRQ